MAFSPHTNLLPSQVFAKLRDEVTPGSTDAEFTKKLRQPSFFTVDQLKAMIKVLRCNGEPKLVATGKKAEMVARLQPIFARLLKNETTPQTTSSTSSNDFDPTGMFNPVSSVSKSSSSAATTTTTTTTESTKADENKRELKTAGSLKVTFSLQSPVAPTGPSSSSSSSSIATSQQQKEAPQQPAHYPQARLALSPKSIGTVSFLSKPPAPYKPQTIWRSTPRRLLSAEESQAIHRLQADLTLGNRASPLHPIVKVIDVVAIHGPRTATVEFDPVDFGQILSRSGGVRVHLIPFKNNSLDPEAWMQQDFLRFFINDCLIDPLPRNWRKKNARVSPHQTVIPLDCTTFITKSNPKLSIKVLFMSPAVIWHALMACVIVETRTVDDLVESLKHTFLPPNAAPAGRQSSGTFENDDELEVCDESVSLRCPLTLLPIRIPVRGRACVHKSCVDLATYLEFADRQRIWNCPICDKQLAYHQLGIDTVMSTVLAAVTDTERVTHVCIHPDNTWEIPSAAAKALAAAAAAGATSTATTTSSSSSSSSSSTPAASSSSSHEDMEIDGEFDGRPKRKRQKVVEVVELDDESGNETAMEVDGCSQRTTMSPRHAAAIPSASSASLSSSTTTSTTVAQLNPNNASPFPSVLSVHVTVNNPSSANPGANSGATSSAQSSGNVAQPSVSVYTSSAPAPSSQPPARPLSSTTSSSSSNPPIRHLFPPVSSAASTNNSATTSRIPNAFQNFFRRVPANASAPLTSHLTSGSNPATSTTSGSANSSFLSLFSTSGSASATATAAAGRRPLGAPVGSGSGSGSNPRGTSQADAICIDDDSD